MGKVKRNPAPIILSSDDDDADKASLSASSSRFSKSVPARKNPKRARRVSLPDSDSRPAQYSHSTGFDEVKMFCEEFNQGFPQFKVPSGSESNKQWVSKYKPCLLEELAVHKKKVEEVKTWFEERMKISQGISHNNVILISGQAGVGKSATVYAIAAHLGAEVFEWNTPTPTIWQEHLHTLSSGIRYMSKMDEFENFVERIRKYGLVSPSMTRVYTKPVIILIDDLPIVNGKISCGRLQRCLHLLLQSVHLPTAILINDYGKSDSAEQQSRYWDELQSSLQSAGAFKVTFNPITANAIKKVLTKICRLERFVVSNEHIDLIANSSGGDIRNAITSLQYFSLKPHRVLSPSTSKMSLMRSEESTSKAGHLDDEVSLAFGKDATLSLFHALGKFLHNKRENESSVASDNEVIILKDKFVRCPVKMDTPEMVLSQAHGQPRLVADFLHENVLDFVGEEAIEDACTVAEYLSDADFLLAPLTGTLSHFDAENVIRSAAVSVAVRGVLFGNTRPISSRWHAIRRPKLWEVDQSLWKNKYHVLNQSKNVHSSTRPNSFTVIATELRPALNWLGHREAVKPEGYRDASDEVGATDRDDDESDEDDIEEW